MLSLESRIKAEVDNFTGEIGLYLNDFKGNIVEVNSREKFESASTIKSYVLAELYKQIHEKKIHQEDIIKYDKEHYVIGSGVMKSLDYNIEMTVRTAATLMIIVSDNVATNMIIDLVGLDNVNNTCEDLGLKDTVLHNKIDFENYPKLGTTTPRDYGKLFEMVYKKELWSKEMSEEMLDIFKKQQYNTMLTKNLPHFYFDPSNTGDEELFQVASKSGSMNTCRNDGGIVFTPHGDYIISLFTKDFQDKLYYSDHESFRYGAVVSRLIFDHFLALEGKLRK